MIKDPIDLSLIRQRLAEGCYDTWGSLEVRGVGRSEVTDNGGG